MLNRITVHGARQHNLKNIDVEIPRNTFTVITGLSGSGKSSLAFDTIYAEGQRRYVETLSPYARQFLDQMERPEVDSIDGLSPGDLDRAEDHQPQSRGRRSAPSPRSTTTCACCTSSIGVPHCPDCGIEISRQTTEQIVEQVMALKAGRARHDPGAGRARPQGRVQERTREAGAAGLRARPRRRRDARHRTRRSRSTSARTTRSKWWWTGCC